MKYSLKILGSRGSFPVEGPQYAEFGGATSCYVLRTEDYAVVIDCGTGFSAAKSVLAGCTKIDILLTHLHYDHTLGFLYPAGIPEDAETRIFVYTQDGQVQEDPMAFVRFPFWPYTPEIGEIHAMPSDVPLMLHSNVNVLASRANHPGISSVLRLDTDEGSFAVICDWEHGEKSVPTQITDECNFILYDGTYTKEEYKGCIGWGHSTWQEGVKLARSRKIGRLFISHHAPSHTDDTLRKMELEAITEFPHTRFLRANDLLDMKGNLLTDGGR